MAAHFLGGNSEGSAERLREPRENEMRNRNRPMRPHEKGLAALYAFLIGLLTLRAIRSWFRGHRSSSSGRDEPNST
jgi:hypothetical protein